MELNAEQIKKALDCCGGDIVECQKCAYVKNGYNRCKEIAAQNALALITSQEQRINELTEENKAWQMQLLSQEEKAGKAYYELACEVEDLRAKNENLHASCTELTRKLECANLDKEVFLKKERADTVRKMQERLHKEAYFAVCDEQCVSTIDIDQIAKEILEGENES